ncbi:hypothetical protein HLB03_05545, partial [Acidianus sp. DSM 29099]|uniref:hypothetical protein n=1 Tax=Candidatus Acidianus copahuensis TaxID=1160895 RepID=UPI0006941721|nr:hypothetical protein [Candidatus Acidianus copahuensis]NON62162.1 hypothetical protein [Acidianus sp. RZ1]
MKNIIRDKYEENGLTLLIGPPEGKVLERFGNNSHPLILNFVPKQGVSNVRVEEALSASLSILNMILE